MSFGLLEQVIDILHLHSASQMMNLFAAIGHHNYAKSTWVYLQMMVDLSKSHPWLYEKFSNEGLFACRRSHRSWAGLWPDLTIEQVMMRAIKNRGRLTRGSGFSESVRVLWVYSMHAAASYYNARINLSKLNKSKALHNELAESRLQ